MAGLPLAFVAGNPTEGEVGVLMPSSPLREPIAAMLLPDPYMLTSLASTITAPHRHHAHPEQEEPLSPKPSPPTTPLRFLFSGYSLWLELKQNKFQNDGKGDLSRMVEDAALRFNTLPIPYPHVTALYGIDLEEGEVRRIFREDVKRVLEDKARERRRSVNVCNVDDNEKMWPDLEALGILVDVEYDGVGNGTMVCILLLWVALLELC
ncbi:hypothetical protein ACHAWO_013630 [Cyclotella atomus]|uniref:Uncharacterized protein n=1 Tax=Cyclotella atomus TaxID=382360 RepID=A0ABD3PT18_9STRA